VIPARFGSTRLPGKPLKDIAGKPMIEWVYRRAQRSGASQVIIATDDQRIAAACRRFAAPVELTSIDHASGTDRIGELAHRFGWDDQQIVVNVQGDEPLIAPASIAQAAHLLGTHAEAAIATLMAPIQDEAQFHDPNFAKVVTDRDGWALYFSRAPIPWPREGGEATTRAYRHIGLYAYRAGFVRRFASWPACELERLEQLEQLRVLWNGERIAVCVADELPGPGVDTPEDLERVRNYFREK